MKLLAVDEARARMLAGTAPLGIETVNLGGCLGRTLARDIIAARDQPPFDASAMDGWAVRAADCPGVLKILGESAAGRRFAGVVRQGEAVRIFTGAALPAGADRVVIQEEARRSDGMVEVPAAQGPTHIRPAGQDFTAGQRLLSAGTRLDPWRLALAAAAGAAELCVSRRPIVAILSTGEEVVEPGVAPGPFQIFNSGGAALAALVRGWGAQPAQLNPVGDDLEATAAAVAAGGGDIVVTLGGASVGDHDLVKPAMARLGLTLIVESIDVRPGKPTWFGVLGDGRPVLGLPGNPASALVCAELFLGPLLLALQGADPAVRLIPARSGAAMAANPGREHWLRARLEHGADGVVTAEAFADQDSSLVRVFADADALVRRGRGAPAAKAGDTVEVLPLARA
jgi:molybdopterin molybdotransferase